MGEFSGRSKPLTRGEKNKRGVVRPQPLGVKCRGRRRRGELEREGFSVVDNFDAGGSGRGRGRRGREGGGGREESGFGEGEKGRGTEERTGCKVVHF